MLALTGADLLGLGHVAVDAASPPTATGAMCPADGHAPSARVARASTAGASAAASASSSLCDEKTVEYLRDLIGEKQALEAVQAAQSAQSPKSIILRLLEQEIGRIQSGGKPPGRENKLVDIYHEKPIRLSVRVLVPVKEHPKFNFVGKLLGPKGNSMKRLQEETMTKMAVLGRGSMRNKQQEEELRASGDHKFAHLHDDLHVEITSFAPPAEAHARLAYALTEVRKYLIPDSNDEIRQEQMREMELLAVGGGGPGGSGQGCQGGPGQGCQTEESRHSRQSTSTAANMMTLKSLMAQQQRREADVDAAPFVQASPRPGTHKAKVMSILDKIRLSSSNPQLLSPSEVALASLGSYLEDRGFCLDESVKDDTGDLGGLNGLNGLGGLGGSLGGPQRGLKMGAFNRGGYRMQLAPYSKPK